MLTVKLKNYTEYEVDKMLEWFEDRECLRTECQSTTCEDCKLKYLCDDITRVICYLRHEQETGYPHCRHKVD